MRLLSVAVLVPASGMNYSYFCQSKCGEEIKTSCNTLGWCNISEGCTWLAENAFTGNDGVCEGFLKSEPACDPVNRVCYEAVDFQLVWDRCKDFTQTAKDKDWAGIGAMFHPSSVSFAPGAAGFADQAEMPQAFAKMGEDVAYLHLEQVLTTGSELNRSIHSTGYWNTKGSNITEPFYARWVANQHGRWVIETLVTQLDGKMTVQAEEDPLLKEIAKRSTDLSEAYNSGNVTELMDFYDEKAVIVTKEERPFEKNDLSTKKHFLGKNAKLEAKLVTKGQGNDAVHEVGFSYSTNAGYLTRWVKSHDTWVVESHVFAVFPTVAAAAEVFV